MRRHLGLILVLVAYVALAVGFSVVTPPFEAPDEIHHYAFIRDLVRDRAIPVQHPGDRAAQRHQPPLYYLAGSLVSFWVDEPAGSPYSVARSNPYWGYAYGEVGRDNKNLYLHGAWDAFPWCGAALGLHLVRLLSVLMGAGAIVAAYAVGREVFPGRPLWALGGTAFMAFNPQFLFISSVVNNDNLIVPVVTLILLLLVRTVKDGITLRRAAWLGVLSGLALLTKLTGLYVLPVVALAFALAAWRKDQWRRFVWAGAITGGLLLVIAGWWFARNMALYGEPTAIKLTLQTWNARPEGVSFGTALFELPNAETSFWARFGYGNVPVPNWIYRLLGALSRIALFAGVGVAYQWIAGRAHSSRKSLALLVLVLSALVIPLVKYDWVFPSALERLALYAPVALLVLLVARRLTRSLWAASGGVREATDANDEISDKMTADSHAPYVFVVLVASALAYFAAMFSYMTMSTTAANGRYMFPGLAAVSLLIFLGVAWLLPRDSTLFVVVLTQGDIRKVRDIRTRPIPWVPGWAVIAIVGMAALGALTLIAYEAQAYSLPPVMPESTSASVPRDLNIDYDGQVRLLGATVAPARLRPGDTAEVTLYWQALKEMKDDYAVFVQCFGRDTARVGQRDSFPGLGNFPTSEWRPGQVIVDTYRVPLDPNAAAPTELTVNAGLYEPGSLSRLPATRASQKVDGATVARARLSSRRKVHYEWQTSVDFKLGSAIALRGYSVDAASLKPGGKLNLKLYWQALAPISRNYTVFVHFLDDTGKVWAQQDAQPVAGSYPTGAWDAQANEIVEDAREMLLPPDLPAGHYRVGLGMYLLETMERLPAADAHGIRLPDDRIILWQGDLK
jgi:4-amino-4-deoxy-L-arabinose transferase-like glycosyltransferase